MPTPVALYLQDAHPLREAMEYVRYAEGRGFEAGWQADSRLVRTKWWSGTTPVPATRGARRRTPGIRACDVTVAGEKVLAGGVATRVDGGEVRAKGAEQARRLFARL
ncbi:MAG TPA: hypothetical protein VHT30_01085 [Acidimicrobiales bacterium]|nr:hypothetical protein [Acidimicrobiales bacterium]